MMSKIRNGFFATVLLVVLLVFGASFLNVKAEEAYDGLQAVITADQESYEDDEVAEVTIVVTNQGTKTVTNVGVECLLPDGVQLADEDSDTATIESLEPGKEIALTVHIVGTEYVAGEETKSEVNDKNTLGTDKDGKSDEGTEGSKDSFPKTGDAADFLRTLLLLFGSLSVAVVTYLGARNRKNTSKHIVSFLMAIAVLVTSVGALLPNVTAKADEGDTASFQASKEILIGTKTYDIAFCVTYDKPESGSSVEEPDSQVTELVDFLVEVESGRDPVVLQLTDPQIADSDQVEAGRYGDTFYSYYDPDNMDRLCFSYIEKAITETKPDLILVTGDVVYGDFDNNGTVLQAFVEFMDSFGIPWAPIFGNHDNVSAKGVDWQCEQFEKR